eukprot:15466042-Alexandrium_andersonii.AAC.1
MLHCLAWVCNAGALRKGGRWRVRTRGYVAVVRGQYQQHALRCDAVDIDHLNGLLAQPWGRKVPACAERDLYLVA